MTDEQANEATAGALVVSEGQLTEPLIAAIPKGPKAQISYEYLELTREDRRALLYALCGDEGEG